MKLNEKNIKGFSYIYLLALPFIHGSCIALHLSDLENAPCAVSSSSNFPPKYTQRFHCRNYPMRKTQNKVQTGTSSLEVEKFKRRHVMVFRERQMPVWPASLWSVNSDLNRNIKISTDGRDLEFIQA